MSETTDIFDLENIKPSKQILPPRIVLYSTPKWGKTTLASTIPNNLFLDLDDGSGAVNVQRIESDKINTYDSFVSALKSLHTQKHNFKAVTIDTIDHLEQLIFTKAAQEHDKENVAEVGYGVGYVTAQNLMTQILDGLNMLRIDRGIMPILIGHEIVKRYDNPLTESYDRYVIKMHDKTGELIKSWADCIFFANNDTFVKSEDVGFKKKVKRAYAGDRIIHTIESPAFVAGNRYGLPAEIPASWEAIEEELAKVMS